MIHYYDEKEVGVIECDECGTTEEFSGDFSDVVEKAKAVGWLCVKVVTFWEHYCYNCK